MTSYTALIKQLLAMPGRKIQTFESFQKLDQALGRPHRAFRIVHVGGTNGKGSVSTKIAEGLRREGKRVGLYTSPHISSFRERIQINGEMIPEDAVERLLPKIWEAGIEPLSFFDCLTALAFLYFAEREVDWAVLEVGMGGRLDPTNVVDPDLTVITSIGYDHMELLGDTLEKIASEKRGIVKRNVPLIVGPQAAPFFLDAEGVSSASNFYDAENSALALIALKRLGVPEEKAKLAIGVRPKCRFEQIGDVILDVAHNPDGFCRLIEALQFHFPGETFHFIVAFSRDKQWRECLDLIHPYAARISFVNSHPRFAPLGGGSLQEALSQKGPNRQVICGSFYLMAEARRSLGIVEPRDPD